MWRKRVRRRLTGDAVPPTEERVIPEYEDTDYEEDDDTSYEASREEGEEVGNGETGARTHTL